MQTFAKPKPSSSFDLPGGGRATIRLATPRDARRLRALYDEVYQGKYPLSIIYDAHETLESLSKKNTYWYISEVGRKLAGSVIFHVDPSARLAKVFAGVVHPDFRGSGLTEKTISFGLRALMEETDQVQSVYATARTVSPAPQKLLKNLGFKELGVFPNVRKIDNYETHCLTAYFKEGALSRRIARPRLPLALKPFYGIVRKATGIEDAKWHDLPLEPSSPYKGGWLNFEIVEAERFIRRRWKRLQEKGQLQMQFFPFHEPNLLLVNEEESAEIYLYYSKPDHHAVIIGGHENVENLTHLLNSLVLCLEEHGVRYLELLSDAYHPKVLKQIMDARFLPSAYYPAMRWKRGKGRDYIVFSKSFVLLDFKSIQAEGLFSDYLSEYFKLWKSFYID